MSEKLYIVWNSASPTTAAQAVTATGAAIKTILQVATPSTTSITPIEWGISFDGSTAATPIKCELIQTDVAATTGTSYTPTLYNSGTGVITSDPPSLCVGGTAATGFGFSVEGTTTVSRVFDAQLVSPTNQYMKQFPLGREPVVPISKFLRVRVTAPVTVNCYAYVIWSE